MVDPGEGRGDFVLQGFDVVLLVVERDDDGNHPRVLADDGEEREERSGSQSFSFSSSKIAEFEDEDE